MSAMAELLDNIVPASELAKQTATTLDKVHVGNPVVIMRRGVPTAVMITPDEWRDYERLRQEAEDAADLAMAEERLARWDGNTDGLRSFDDVMEELGVTEEDLASVGEVEFE